MRDGFWTVIFPFVMCFWVWFVSRVKKKDKKKLCAWILLLASAVEFVVALGMVLCDLRGFAMEATEVPGVGGLGLHCFRKERKPP